MGLYYQSRASTTSECAGLWVGAQIRVYVAGQVLSDQYLCNYNAVNEWTFGYFDLSAAAGQTVEIGFRADAANSVWSYLYLDDISVFSSFTGVENNSFPPQEFMLAQNYPNPFNPSTIISWQLAVNSHVTLKVYDIIGNEVATLVNEDQPAGNYEVEFDASKLSSGIYFYEINTGTFRSIKKMILLK
ncbi:MAG: T9SS type A sorting domain-containing protein [Ignavibacteriaceae bacterium]